MVLVYTVVVTKPFIFFDTHQRRLATWVASRGFGAWSSSSNGDRRVIKYYSFILSVNICSSESSILSLILGRYNISLRTSTHVKITCFGWFSSEC